MKNRVLKQPFKGQPKTVLSYDRKDNPRFDVTIRELTPFRARAADTTSALTCWGGFAYVAYKAATLPGADWQVWLAAFALPVISWPVTKWLARRQFRKATKLRFTADEFQKPGLLRAKSYDRQLPHSFLLLPHDKREDEQEKLQFEAAKARARGKWYKPERYYGKSFHLVFEYLGERHDVAAIYGEREAKRALDRLTSIDNVIDPLTATGPGTAIRPGDEWNPQAGDLLE